MGSGTICNRRYFIDYIVDEGFGIYVSREDGSQYVAPLRRLVSRAEIDTLKRKHANESSKERKRELRQFEYNLQRLVN